MGTLNEDVFYFVLAEEYESEEVFKAVKQEDGSYMVTWGQGGEGVNYKGSTVENNLKNHEWIKQ